MQKKQLKKEEIAKRDQYTIVLEDIRHMFEVLKEGQSTVKEEIKNELNEKFDSFREELKDELSDFRRETSENFKQVMACFSNVEDDFLDLKKELKNMRGNQIEDAKRMDAFEARIAAMEREMDSLRSLVQKKEKIRA